MRFKPVLNLTTFDRTPEQDSAMASLLTALHGRATQLPKVPRRPIATLRERAGRGPRQSGRS